MFFHRARDAEKTRLPAGQRCLWPQFGPVQGIISVPPDGLPSLQHQILGGVCTRFPAFLSIEGQVSCKVRHLQTFQLRKLGLDHSAGGTNPHKSPDRVYIFKNGFFHQKIGSRIQLWMKNKLDNLLLRKIVAFERLNYTFHERYNFAHIIFFNYSFINRVRNLIVASPEWIWNKM